MSVRYVSFVGRSNCGKTTLITRLIPILSRHNLRIGSIKHTHHQAEFDKPGKDSWMHRSAGSQQVLLLSHDQLALYTDRPPNLSLAEAVQRWFGDFDLVISEGFKSEPGLKIEVYRQASGKTPLYPDPAMEIAAVVRDGGPGTDLTCFDFDQVEALADWILEKTGLTSRS